MRTKFLLLSVVLFAGCGGSNEPLPVLSDKFKDIQTQTFDKSCAYAGCHDATEHKAELCLTSDSCYSQLLFTHQYQQNGSGFSKLVVPGNPDSSFLVYVLTKANGSTEYGDRMPQRLGSLPQNEIDAIVSWIKRGAPND